MTATRPRVQDFTADPGRFPIEVSADPVFELLLSLFAYSAMEDGSPDNYSVGSAWLDAVRSQASPELSEALEQLAGTGDIWIEMVGLALALPDPLTAEGLVRHLRAMDPVDLRLDILIRGCMHCSDELDDDVVRTAAIGTDGALERLTEAAACEPSPGTRRVLEMSPEESAELLTSTIEWFDRDVFHGGGDIGPVLARDADHKRALSRTMTAPRLVELATNGITFEPEQDVDGIVLIPSAVIRPWVTIASHGRWKIFCYPIAEEHLTADPDSPPLRLVEIYKALGDERRLRLLRMVSEEPASLAEITDRIGLAKSTVHHHLSILRQAGLVLITIGTDKVYSLRRDAVPEAADLLAGFLS